MRFVRLIWTEFTDRNTDLLTELYHIYVAGQQTQYYNTIIFRLNEKCLPRLAIGKQAVDGNFPVLTLRKTKVKVC